MMEESEIVEAQSPKKMPLSDVRHLGTSEIIEFANQLRQGPGKDLGAEAALLSRSAPALPPKKPWKPRKKKGAGEEDGLTAEEQKAKELSDLKCAQLLKVIEGLNEQKAKMEAEVKETQDKALALGVQMKGIQGEEATLGDDLEKLNLDNEDLTKDVDRNNDRCVQERIIIGSSKAKVEECRNALAAAEEAENNPGGGGLKDIKMVFGPNTANTGELQEHNGELDWFDSIQVPNAISTQQKLKADRSRKTGGRTATHN